jgi:hypothetical protein
MKVWPNRNFEIAMPGVFAAGINPTVKNRREVGIPFILRRIKSP